MNLERNADHRSLSFLSGPRATPTTDDATDFDLAARTPVNAMVTARTGADRAAWARTIHDRSARRHRPFVAVSGSAPLAVNRTPRAEDVDDWFVRAAGGTLFVDRVGELSASAQARLSSLLTAQSCDAGAAAMPHADHHVRVIAGCNRSLRADLAVGAFSDTLFYRLNVIHIDQMHHILGENAMKARDIMSKPPHACQPNTDLATVAKIMWDHDCGFVPVVDAAGRVTGVVTDRDICIATSTRRVLPDQITAAQAMMSPVYACLSDDTLSDALAMMKQFRIRRVPVVDAHGRLQGVISLNDIVLASNQKQEPPAADVLSTMAAICAHRPVDVPVA